MFNEERPRLRIGQPSPTITAHAQVRYLERFVDERAAQAARTLAGSDAVALQSLCGRFADDLAQYRERMAGALRRLASRGPLPFETYRVRAGDLSIVMVGDTCV